MDLNFLQRLLQHAKYGRSNDGEEEDSSPPSSPPLVKEDGFQYDVFLSFRGPDTRKTFADLLYEALTDKGITTFIDSEKLEKGQKLDELFERIQRSKIFVPIFSPGYADSKWCLKEIAKMVECKRVILPLFVDVEPTDVRNQTGPFKSAFSKHRKNKEIDEVEVSNWSNALKEAGNISGYPTRNRYLGKLIQQIVKRILREVNKTCKPHVAQHPVGLESRVADVIKVLETEAQDDVRMVGISGIGGMGKTTLSTAVYNEISSRFDACSFISNVREAAERPSGLVSLQKQLLGDVFSEKDVTLSNTSDGLGKIKERIGAKKVLLVLDDVNNVSQINDLVGQLAWFRKGSRIIITTRDKRVLTSARVKKEHMYELKELDDIQSLELFSFHAFGKKEPDAKFAALSSEVASTAAGLPLALTIFGSHFFDLPTVEDWQDMLKKLKENLDKDIFERLRISFDVLDKSEREIFLDIACFFVGQETKHATHMWEACGFSPKIAISWLIHKSLVTVNHEGKFEMHDLVRDMGRQIVQAKAEEAGKYSRLWKDDETVDVLAKKRGTEDVEAIQIFCEEKDSVYVDVECLAAMSQLRMFLAQDVTLKGGYEHFPRKLKWLKWRSQALEKFSIPLHLEMLVVLDLSCSSITQVRDPHKMKAKVFKQLKVLDLSGCGNLHVGPDFASMIHLEMLSFDGCVKLSKLHPSIGLLKCLAYLSLRRCRSLKQLPQEVWQLTSLLELDFSGCERMTAFPSQIRNAESLQQPYKLERLDLSDCSELIRCPDFTSMPHLQRLSFRRCGNMTKLDPSIGQVKRLRELDLSDCESLKELPQEIGQLSSLERLTLENCSSLREVPQEVWQLTSLQELNLVRCWKITALPSQIQNAESLLLERLDLSDCWCLIRCPDFTTMPHLQRLSFSRCGKITELDPSIGQLEKLTELNLYECESLEELPQAIGRLTSLKKLTLIGCSSLKEVPQEVWQLLTSLPQVRLSGCKRITALPSHIGNAESLQQPYKLERLNLGYCSNLIRCPDFTSMPHLLSLSLKGCEKMTELDPSIGQLKRLRELDLEGCESLKELPQQIGQLTSLQELTLKGCSSLKELPQEVWQLTSLPGLNLSGCKRITALPSQIWNAELLQTLFLGSCSNLIRCPDFASVPHLRVLWFHGCEKITELSPSIGQLKMLRVLNLHGCKSLKELPQEIGLLTSLESLDLEGCSFLKEVPLLPPSLNELNASHCDQLEIMADVSNLKGLQKLSLSSCTMLEDIPAIEQLKCLKWLHLGGCGRLADSLFERVQEANFQHLDKFSIPGRLINDGTSDRQSIAFILPKQFDSCHLRLYVDRIWLCRSVHVDITTDDAQLHLSTLVNILGTRFPTATFAWNSELMMMANRGRLKGMDVDDAQERAMMEMRVSIDGCILLHGDFEMPKLPIIYREYGEDSDDDFGEDRHDNQNIVVVKFE